MSTLANLLNDVAHNVSIRASDIDISNPNDITSELLSLVTLTGNDIMRFFEWRELIRTGVSPRAISFPVSTRHLPISIDLPEDFHRLAGRGASSQNYILITNDDVWNTVVRPEHADPDSSDYQLPEHTYFRLTGQTITLLYGKNAYETDGDPRFNADTDPHLKPPQISYVSRLWVDGDKAIPNAHSDTFRIPYDLLLKGTIWRYYRNKGVIYEDYYQEYHHTFRIESFANRGFEGTPGELETNLGS